MRGAQCKHYDYCGFRGGCGSGCGEVMRALGFNATEHCWGELNWPTCGPARAPGQ